MAWMAGNSVAANLLMAVFLVGGLVLATQVKQEVFPEFDSDTVTISVSYAGASPEEVETSVIQAVEEAVQGLEGVDTITATASEGSGTVTIEALEGADVNRLWQEAQSEVERIGTFPDEADDPQVTISEHKHEVISLVLYGDAGEAQLREQAELVRDELLNQDRITQVDLSGVRDYEIHVEVPQETLRRYGLTLADISEKVAKASVELGGGSLDTSSGEILVRVKDQRNYAQEYAEVPLFSGDDGSRVLLGDLAEITEGFEESDSWASYDGQRAVMINVYRVGEQTPTEVSEAALEVVEQAGSDLPPGLNLTMLSDSSEMFTQRAELLLKNAYMGLAVVFLCLALFLEIRLAFWVSLGIPIAFLGSFLFLPATDFSINMITMFAFIVTLGIVVDDAVVVGESIYYERKKGSSLLSASIRGARNVVLPVVFSVLTNIVAFLPLMFVPGMMGKMFHSIPVVVAAVFLVSLVESLFILPAHLSHGGGASGFPPLAWLERRQQRFSTAFERFVRQRFAPLLERSLKYRYTVIALGLALLLCTAGWVFSGRMGLVLFPAVDSDFAYCSVELPYGSPVERTRALEERLVRAAEAVIEENGGEKLADGVYSRVNENAITVQIFLTESEVRALSTTQVTQLWREKVGAIAGVESLSFESNRGGPGSGKNLTIQLSHRDVDVLKQAGADLAERLTHFAGVFDIDDGSAQGKRQFDVRLTGLGESAGLTSRDVANQLRYAFYGAEAVKLQRGRNEVTVRVRLPEGERASEATFEDLVLLIPDGGEMLLRDAASVEVGRAYTSIDRSDGRRIATVTANVKPDSQAETMVSELSRTVLPELVAAYPGLSFSFEGHQADLRESIASLVSGLLLALLGIYAMLAIPFKDYFQPLIIMFCIPFGIVGAVLGHLLLGYSLSLMSLFGVVALSGVVVNDSLVLIDLANRLRRQGASARQAVLQAAVQRFRPILLTTLTTFGGLAPMILETSREARFLIPMAISLGFGILFATFITLGMVPALYLVLEDVAGLFHRGRPGSHPEPSATTVTPTPGGMDMEGV